MIEVEIRCCCDAGKLLGTVPVPAIVGAHFTWRFKQADGAIEEFRLPWGRVLAPPGLSTRGEYIRALKSMDTPIEKLRRLPGFKEHNG